MNKMAVFANVIPFVIGTEAALGPSVPGADKKQKVLALLQALAAAGETFPAPLVAEISALIDVTVTVFLKPAPAPNPAAS